MMKKHGLPKKCTGCGACADICSNHAIKMQLDKDGFYKPIIDKTLCVDCNLCRDYCPVNHPVFSNEEKPDCYAFMAEDDIRIRSSSGGVFECLANVILEEHGCVVGVAYREDFTTQHILIEDKKDIAKLRGSKYIMSDVNHIYCDVLEKLKANRRVLFTGCPCQIAGLYSYVGEIGKNENLITVDLICHGIPSVKAFKKYLSDVHGNKKMTHVGFKDKEYGWHASMTIDFEQTGRYNEPCEQDTYFWSYLCGVNRNEACGSCPFARLPRQGDITIGDFWGIGKYKPEWNDGKGTSVVLLNNPKGKMLFEKIIGKAKLVEKASLDAVISGNSNLVCSPRNHISRNQFFKNLEKRKFPELVRWSYGAERFDIGLVGIPIYINFGGSLTYFALYKFLSDSGYQVMLISRPRSCGRAPIPFELVYEKNPYPSNALRLELKNKEEMRRLNEVCETFMVGSDQLFNADLYYRFGEMVTLDWVSDNHRKVAYAASFGHHVFWGREEQRADMAHYMQKFDAFSVREVDGVDLAKDTFGIDAEWVLDPIFLCNKEHFIRLAEQTSEKRETPHIFAYLLDPNSQKNEILQYIAEEMNSEVELFGDMLFRPNEEKLKIEQKKYMYELRQAKIEERLYSLIHSDFVVTDSYHGVCFAILFQIPFVAILNENRGASRFYTILSKLHLMDRLVTSIEETKKSLLDNLDFSESYKLLEKERKHSAQWLLEAVDINRHSAKPFSSVDIVNRKLDLQKREDYYRDIKINAILNGRLFCTVSEINGYLDMLFRYRKELVILLAVRDTPGFELKEEIAGRMTALGCREILINKHWKSYVLVIDGGQMVREILSKNEERVAYNGMISDRSVKIVSRSYRQGDVATIIVDGVDYSENHRGLNIVVVDKNLRCVIDSVAFDTHMKGIPCYREKKLCSTGMPEGKKEETHSNSTNEFNNTESRREKNDTLEDVHEIKKANEVFLHNAMVIAVSGGTAFDYYIDKGIRQIALYGTDLLTGFLWEQAYYKEIEIVELISDKERDINVRFPRAGNIHMKYMSLDEMKKLEVPILLAEGVFPLDLLNLRENGKSVERIGQLLYYSHLKHFLLDPLLNYKEKYPNIQLVICNMPAAGEIENKTEREKLLITSKVPGNITFEKVFQANGYDQEYMREVCQRMNIDHRLDCDFITPHIGKYVSCIEGYRLTTDSPVDFSNTIYTFGNSLCYGVGTHDECTISSVVQREINDYYDQEAPYSVLNCSNGGGLNAFQIWKSVQYHMPQNGDIIILIMNNFIDLFKEIYGTSFLWCDGKEVLNRPHNMGEIYVDPYHLNAKGYEAIGRLIASKLIQHHVLLSREKLNKINKINKINRNRLIPTMNLEMKEKEQWELETYIKEIQSFRNEESTGKRVGSIVMNCNPFTLGHRYLIEEARKQCDLLYIFIVEEDRSFFSFIDRIDLVRKGTNDLENVIVIPSGKFIISQTTFSGYFLKEQKRNVVIDPSDDVCIFGARIAPSLGINIRFVGDEPFDHITAQYNAAMKRLLPKYGIAFEMIKRKEVNGKPVSASQVRKLLKTKEFDLIRLIVPDSTFQFLQNRYRDSKNVLVLGGTRFMGIRLVEKLLKKNWFVTIATRGCHSDTFDNKVFRIILDRSNEASCKSALEGMKFDIVFDNTAYASNPVKYVLTYIKCDHYIQISSVAVYQRHHLEMRETELDTRVLEFSWSDKGLYGCGKRYAECAALQSFAAIPSSIVRIPFVVETEHLENEELNMRLFFIAEHIIQEKPMRIDSMNYSCAFVRTSEEADFLIYLAEHKLTGIYNFSSEGRISVGEIISYIEKKSGIQAIYQEDGDLCPFYAAHFGAEGVDGISYDLEKAKSTGFPVSRLNEWIYELLDGYIEELQKGKRETDYEV